MNPDKMPPHNVEAEEALLGSVIIDNDAYHLAARLLSGSGDFYIEKNAWVWEAFAALADRREPTDFVTLCDELGDKLTEIGGAAYVTRLINAVPSALHVESYARRVADDARRRRLVRVASKIAQAGYNAATADEAEAQAQAALIEATAQRGAGEARAARDVASTVYDRMREYEENPLQDGASRFLDTGWPDLNRAIGGWRPGLHIIFGVPHIGKSWVLLHTVAHCLAAGGRVAYFSLEMLAEDLVERLCLAHAGLSPRQFERFDVDAASAGRFAEMLSSVSGWDWVLDDSSETVSHIAATARREHLRKPLDMVVVDPLKLIRGSHRENRNLELADYTGVLKLLSRSLAVPILVAHHAGDKTVGVRADHRPRIADLYESGHISMDSDTVIGVDRPEVWDDETERAHIMDLLVLKDKLGNGAGRVVSLFFSSRCGKMSSAETRQQEPQPLELDDGWAGRKDIF